MRANRGFIDLLFILLCVTIVLLSQSLQIGTVNAAPARVGGGGISDILAQDVRPVVVRKDHLLLDGTQYQGVDQIVPELDTQACVVLIAGDVDITHHRIMRIWSQFNSHGLIAKLGVKKDDANLTGKVDS